MLELVEPCVDGVDEGDRLHAALGFLKFGQKNVKCVFIRFGQFAGWAFFRLGLKGGDPVFKITNLCGFRASQTDPARQRIAHGAHKAQVRWRTLDRKTGPCRTIGGGLFQALFQKVGQFQIFEKDVQKLVTRQTELKFVLALAIGAGL